MRPSRPGPKRRPRAAAPIRVWVRVGVRVWVGVWVGVWAALGSAACASLPGPERPFPGNEPRAAVVIDSSDSGYVGMIVFIASRAGGPTRLGSVSIAPTSRFEIRDVRTGEYVLEGRQAGQPTLRSPTFLLRDGDTVEWNLRDNRVSYR